MNLQIIKDKVEECKFPGGVKALAESVGMTVQNLHRCVRENKIQAQDLENIARTLKINVSIFFDADVTIAHEAKTISATNHGAASESGPATSMHLEGGMNTQELQEQLIKAQQRIIELLTNKA